MVSGVAYASLKELTFTWLSFWCAMASNVVCAARGVVVKACCCGCAPMVVCGCHSSAAVMSVSVCECGARQSVSRLACVRGDRRFG